MEIDAARLAGLVVREVASEEREGRPARVVIATRPYDTTMEDLWDAITNPERIPRWFLPISGDLRKGGSYQLEGNAGGTITDCEAPSFFAATWEFGGGISWLEVELVAQADSSTLLRLKHTALEDEMWGQFGPGAVGVGWDLGLLGLHLHLPARATLDAAEFEAWSISPQGKEFGRLCAAAWGEAAIAAGDDPEQARAAAERTRAFYAGEGDEGAHEA